MTDNIRVLHLFHEYLNGSENWAFRMLDNLPDCEVVVASKWFKKCNFYSSKFEYIEFPLKMIEQNTTSVSVTMINKIVLESARLYPWYLRKMVGHIDLMHSHFAHMGWQYSKLAKRLNVPHIVSFYGFDYENLPHIHPVWKERYKILFEEVDLFLCEGYFGAQLLKNLGCSQEKVGVARLGVDTEKIPCYSRDKKCSELNLLQIATLVGKKGHVYTVRAFIQALKTCPNMTLTLVGKDLEGIKAELLMLINESNVQDRVTFLDWIDFDHLHEFMKDYQVFIHPSCYTPEKDCEGGAPVVLLDAQATGMPVISTNHCDIPDEVIHAKTGFLAQEKDVAALTSFIEEFYRMDEPVYREFCNNARSHIESFYDAKKNGANLREIYAKLMKS